MIRELACDRELEALCQESEWTCAVLPGIGFGWVTDDQIISNKRKPIHESDCSVIDVKWTWARMPNDPDSFASFQLFLERVRCHLSYLDLSENGQAVAVFLAILRHCVKLKHLRMKLSAIEDDTVSMLIDQLNDEIEDHLMSLDVNHNLFSSSSIENVARFLSNRDQIPALQELRICGSETSYEALASLRQALHVNKKLRFLELLGPGTDSDSEDEDEEDDEKQHVADQISRAELERALFVDEADGKLLLSYLAPSLKLGFLSVIQHKTMARTALHELDSFIVSSIFKFALKEVRRHILSDEP